MMGRIKSYIRPYYLFILFTMLIKLAGAVAELFVPYFMELILSDCISGDHVKQSSVYLYGGMMLLCAGICLALNITANHMSALSAGRITQKLRHDLFQKLGSLSAKQLDEVTVSSAQSRLTSDTYHINQFLARGQRLGIRAPILLVGGILMMLSMDAKLALVPIALLPLIAVIVFFVTRKTIPLYTQEQGVLDRMVNVVQENISGVRVIKALSKTEYEKKRFAKVNDALSATGAKAASVSSITMPAASLVLNIGLTLVVLVGAYLVNSGDSTPSVIVAFLQYFVMILNAMLGVTRIFIMASRGQSSALRVADILEMPEDLVVQKSTNVQESAPHIEFRNVHFSYTGVGSNLNNLSFRLQHGQTLGILGATGSGKSTLVNLLMRLYDVDEGEILIDGRDVRTLAPEELRKKFGVVFQNDFIAEGTIESNIRFFRELSEEELSLAAEVAQAAEFIAGKEGGMQAEVAVRGNNLSGGQKQRLLIARALAAKPEILVLDDASSALDYRTDSMLRRALAKRYADTTTILIAQRISSLRHADLILVLQDGELIGHGTHEELLSSCEEYQLIAHTQMGTGEEAAV